MLNRNCFFVCKCYLSGRSVSHKREHGLGVRAGDRSPRTQEDCHEYLHHTSPSKKVSAKLLHRLLWGMQESGPSGKQDSDNKALQIASCTLMVFKCEQEVNAALCGEMKFRVLSKRALFWCLGNCRLDANTVLIFDHL